MVRLGCVCACLALLVVCGWLFSGVGDVAFWVRTCAHPGQRDDDNNNNDDDGDDHKNNMRCVYAPAG